jgi:hypothetical protein
MEMEVCEDLTILKNETSLFPKFSFADFSLCEISGFCCNVDEVFTLQVCYTAYVGSCLLTFWDSLPVPSSRAKQSNLLP